MSVSEATVTGSSDRRARHRVVVVGSGFGGLFAARALVDADVDITLVDRTSHHLFQPLLYQVATGILSEGEIAPAVRLVLEDQDNATVRMGEVYDVDPSTRTVHSRHGDTESVLEYDSLVVAAGARQSYFGNDHFAENAPGLKSIDDALEIRARILGAFEQAEVTDDPDERRRLLTFVVVGAGPTGVEMAGEIAELARRTLAGAYRTIDPREARVVLVDAAPTVLPPFAPALQDAAAAALGRLGVQIELGAVVTGVDAEGVTLRSPDGSERRIEAACKVWSAGVAASPLGAVLADRTGAELDRAGRILVEPDLSVAGHPDIFVVGDMMNRDGLPGVAQVAIQGGRHAAAAIVADVKALAAGRPRPERTPFRYRDKGSMAVISRFNAVASVGRLELSGALGWFLWLVVHLAYIVGFRSRLTTTVSWTWSFLGRSRPQFTATDQQAKARGALRERANRITHPVAS